MLKIRLYRWRRRILLPLASLPLFQAMGTCQVDQIVGSFLTQLGLTTFNIFVGSVQQVLLQSFPSADILQVFLGANRQPFFTG